MNALHQDTLFRLSKPAQERLRASAKEAGVPTLRYFRVKAYQLVRIADPKFDVSGEPLTCRVDVGIAPHILESLQELCSDLDIAWEAAGELVACASFAPALPA